jgi:hypothetical protein
MTKRKRKLRLIQISLLSIGLIFILFSYSQINNSSNEEIVSKKKQEKIKNQISNTSENNDVFYNIEYSGLDLSGNRYILKSEEALTTKENQELVYMKIVEATFYFKDDTILYIWSDNGIYNNKTLDMIFENNIKASYEKSELFAEKAEYSNSKGFLTITNKVKVIDFRGTMLADKLLFDIKKQKLNIVSFNNNKINANINLK